MKALKTGDSITIGSKGYTIGSSIKGVTGTIKKAQANDKVTINGTEYTVVAKPTDEDATENKLTADNIASMINDGAKVIYKNDTYVAMVDEGNDGVGDNDASIITSKKAYELINAELAKASDIGTDPGHRSEVTTKTKEADMKTADEIVFQIKEGDRKVTQGLQIGLHVGADADENNKISFTVDTMDSAGLGVKGLNLVDKTGAKATYAIDSIADAISKVSAQRSSLGAVQNRLEHTINNLDNVVENTTSAESQIRDTDMAETMVEYSKNNILAQAGQSMLAQANQSNQGVLSLLG